MARLLTVKVQRQMDGMMLDYLSADWDDPASRGVITPARDHPITVGPRRVVAE